MASCANDPNCCLAVALTSSSHGADVNSYEKEGRKIPLRLYDQDQGFDRTYLPPHLGPRHIFAYPGANAEGVFTKLQEELQPGRWPFKYHRFYVMAGSNRDIAEYDTKGAKRSAAAVSAIVNFIESDAFLCDGGRVKVILPPPRRTYYADAYGKYLKDLHKELLKRLTADVYNSHHIVRGWYLSTTQEMQEPFSANPAVMYDDVHLNKDGYRVLQDFLLSYEMR